MKLLLLLACQSALAFNLVPEDFDFKNQIVRRQGDKIFPLRLEDYDPAHNFTLAIKSVHLEGKKEVHSVVFVGTGDEVNAQLDAKVLPFVTAHTENHNVTVTVKDQTTGQESKAEYTFKAMPHIEVEELLSKATGPVAYPFRSHRVILPESLKNVTLKVVPEKEDADVEMAHDDGHITLNLKGKKAMPQLKFHLADEHGKYRSADLYTLPQVAHAPKSSSKTFAYISGVLVIIMLAVIVVYYSRKKEKTDAFVPDRPTMVPGLGNPHVHTNPNVPQHISLPVDNAGNTYGNPYGKTYGNVLDLKDAHNK